MSHSVVVVLLTPDEFEKYAKPYIDRNEDNPDKTAYEDSYSSHKLSDLIGEKLEPFDENLDVPEYDRKCYCINRIAFRESDKMAQEKYGEISLLRETFYEKEEVIAAQSAHDEEKLDTLWKEYLKPYNDFREASEKEHPLYEKPDPECNECHGTGLYKSEYNPQSKWDWYIIGGRWAGEARKIAPLYHGNILSVSGLLEHDCKLGGDVNNKNESYYPFSILAPESEWIERGNMGWWGMVSDEKDNWPDVLKETLTKYQDHYGVLVDVHI